MSITIKVPRHCEEELEETSQLLDDLEELVRQGRIQVRNTPNGPEWRVIDEEDPREDVC